MDWTGWTYLNRTSSGPGWTGQFSEWAGLDGLLKNQMGLISTARVLIEPTRSSYHYYTRASIHFCTYVGKLACVERNACYPYARWLSF